GNCRFTETALDTLSWRTRWCAAHSCAAPARPNVRSASERSALPETRPVGSTEIRFAYNASADSYPAYWRIPHSGLNCLVGIPITSQTPDDQRNAGSRSNLPQPTTGGCEDERHATGYDGSGPSEATAPDLQVTGRTDAGRLGNRLSKTYRHTIPVSMW